MSATPDRVGARLSAPALVAASARLSQLVTVLTVWAVRARTRRELRELDPDRLADLGLDILDARREAAKRCWRP